MQKHPIQWMLFAIYYNKFIFYFYLQKKENILLTFLIKYDIILLVRNVEKCNFKGAIIMKSTGIIRRVDELGRVVLPIELRNKFGITEKDPMEIYVDGSSIILKKYEPNCIFCGSSKKLLDYQDKVICEKCAEKISKLKA